MPRQSHTARPATATGPAEARWPVVVAALRGKPGVSVTAPAPAAGGHRFGSTSLRVHNRIFAMIGSQGRFVVKLPAQRVEKIIASGDGEHFDRNGQRWMKEWVAMAPRTQAQWPDLAAEAMEFVGAGVSARR